MKVSSTAAATTTTEATGLEKIDIEKERRKKWECEQ